MKHLTILSLVTALGLTFVMHASAETSPVVWTFDIIDEQDPDNPSDDVVIATLRIHQNRKVYKKRPTDPDFTYFGKALSSADDYVIAHEGVLLASFSVNPPTYTTSNGTTYPMVSVP